MRKEESSEGRDGPAVIHDQWNKIKNANKENITLGKKTEQNGRIGGG